MEFLKALSVFLLHLKCLQVQLFHSIKLIKVKQDQDLFAQQQIRLQHLNKFKRIVQFHLVFLFNLLLKWRKLSLTTANAITVKFLWLIYHLLKVMKYLKDKIHLDVLSVMVISIFIQHLKIWELKLNVIYVWLFKMYQVNIKVQLINMESVKIVNFILNIFMELLNINFLQVLWSQWFQ